jgi:TPR repeat protein
MGIFDLISTFGDTPEQTADHYFRKGQFSNGDEWLEFLLKAANLGHCEAQIHLGCEYSQRKLWCEDFEPRHWRVELNDVEAVMWFQKAAEQWHASEAQRAMGDAEYNRAIAQYYLGAMYKDGRGVAQNDVEAVRWFQKSANGGFADAQNKLGFMLMDGRGIGKNDVEAVKWFQEAAKQGHNAAQGYLGFMLKYGRGVAQNDVQAVKWFQKPAEQGYAWVQYELGCMLMEGRGAAQNDVQAVKWFQEAAEQGHAQAQANLGSMLMEGRGVAQNDVEAVKWFQKAAEQGDAEGQNLLGFMFSEGRGVAQNDVEAVKWYQKAAKQGNVGAPYWLGVMFMEGRGVTQNDAEAVKWFQKAAERGNVGGQYSLGVMFKEGRGIAQNDVEAVKWFQKAAEQEDPEGQYSLGVMSKEGRGVAQDDAEAFKWFQKAADQGYTWAQYALGSMFMEGRGVAKNDVEAFKWLLRAAEQGDEDAIAAASVLQSECPAATKVWTELSAGSLEGLPLGGVLPVHVRVGTLVREHAGGAASIPCCLPLSRRKGLFFGSSGAGRTEMLLQTTGLRLACSLPVGLLCLHLIDVASRGRAFSVLGGMDPKIAPPVPSTPGAVTALLEELEARVSEVTRKCLSRHEWLCEYNAANPDEPEPYHVVLISGYPEGLEPEAVEAVSRLLLHECGARAGVYFLISSTVDKRALPADPAFQLMPLIFTEGGKAEVVDQMVDTSENGEFKALTLVPDGLPENAVGWVDALNARVKAPPKAKKVSLVFEEGSLWGASAANGVSIPIGKAGREDVQLKFGNDSVVHHALIGGATGSGKTVLLHNIILNSARLYSPKDLQLVLMDFKEGTEFACYEGLPHLRVLAVASEVHFGKNVLEWLVAERMRRASLFKKTGSASLGDYLGKGGVELPRILVVMDEFQRLLSDGQVGAQVAMLLDDLVRTGRSFGINLILSTQSLASVPMEGSTLTSLGVRVCMRLSEQETTRFLSYDNTLPSGFTRPGQAVYNDAEGRKDGNREFQVAYVDTGGIAAECGELRERELKRFHKAVVATPRVFQGEAAVNPAGRLPAADPAVLQAFLGEPLQVDAVPVSVQFQPVDGANLVGVVPSLEVMNFLSRNIAIQILRSPLGAEVLVADGLPLAKERWADVDGVRFLGRPPEIQAALDELCVELGARREAGEGAFAPRVLLLIEPQGSRAFPVVGAGGESSPAAVKIQALLEQGARHGIHLVLLTSRLSRAEKVLNSFGSMNLQPFGFRMAFRSEEAANLVGYDAPAANLGEYTGLFYEETSGEVLPFQTYAPIE